MAVSKTIRAATTEGDMIAVFGSEPEIYFYSGRRSATSYIYMYDLTKAQSHQQQMRDEMMRQVTTARPSIIVYVDDWASWGWLPGHEHDKFFTWMENYIRAGYKPLTQIEINAQSAHRWGQAPSIYVFRRTGP